VGFQTLGAAGALGNVTPADNDMDPQLRLLLKKLGKRDAVTKTKVFVGVHGWV
jgi:hypothetical protein